MNKDNRAGILVIGRLLKCQPVVAKMDDQHRTSESRPAYVCDRHESPGCASFRLTGVCSTGAEAGNIGQTLGRHEQDERASGGRDTCVVRVHERIRMQECGFLPGEVREQLLK